MGKTSIQWTANEDGTPGKTWNPLRGCTEISPGCAHCYAATMAARFSGPGQPYEGLARFDKNHKAHWTGEVRLAEEKLAEPLRWRKPARVFVNSMSDLFHEDVPDAWIDAVFAVMAMAPRHTFQVLTKRAARMADYCSDSATPFRVAKAMDRMIVAEAMKAVPERVEPFPGAPGYFISNHGYFLTSSGSATCLQCGRENQGDPRKKFCSVKCKSLDYYHRKEGNKTESEPTFKLTRMTPDVGEAGHERVSLKINGDTWRWLVHRAVLTVFDRTPNSADEQGCHRDGNPSNNHIVNLRWGTQADNWEDRKRHGNGRSYSKLTPQQVDDIRSMARSSCRYSIDDIAEGFGVSDTQVLNILGGRQWSEEKPIEWPLPNCWKGVSVEDQKNADDRIPHLLRCPAAVRFLSVEPMLSAIDLTRIDLGVKETGWGPKRVAWDALTGWEHQGSPESRLGPGEFGRLAMSGPDRRVDWVIVGGESGPHARPFDLAWARDLRDQCEAAGVPYFLKQLGSDPIGRFSGEISTIGRNHQPFANGEWRRILDSHGGDESEWPEDLRGQRAFPKGGD